MESTKRGSRQNPCKTRAEAITLAKQDARAVGHCQYTTKEPYDGFSELKGVVPVPILSRVYSTDHSYTNAKKERITHVAIQDHYLGHYFGGSYEPPHIHATQLSHVERDSDGKPGGMTEINRHDRMAECQEHYYYQENEDDNVSEDEGEKDESKRKRKQKYKELREARDKQIFKKK